MIRKRKIERQSQNGHTELENEDNEFNIGNDCKFELYIVLYTDYRYIIYLGTLYIFLI